MRKCLIRNAVIMTFVPLFSIVVLSLFWNDLKIRNLAMILGMTGQIVIIFLCRKNVRAKIKPSMKKMISTGAESMGAAYEPGKFITDYRVSGIISFAGLLAPVFVYLAQCAEHEVTISVLNFVSYTAPDMVLMAAAVAAILLGVLGMALWTRFGQVMVIANERSERIRYMYRGYAEQLENI